MSTAILFGFILAVFAPVIHRIVPRFSGGILAVFPLGLLLYFCQFLSPISHNEGPVTFFHSWIPSLGINFAFHLDGLSLLFVLLISGIGAMIVIYGQEYLKGHPQLGHFYAYLLVFLSSMLGLVLSSNLLTLFIFWELTSLSSYFLIGFNHEQERSRTAALQALLVTGGGGLALLAGLLLLGSLGQCWEFTHLLEQAALIKSSSLYIPIFILICLGAFTKSAQFPFHFWLPNAMEAPTPVSAYLHSATMVKAGIYLLARLYPILGGTQIWMYTLLAVGAMTMVTAAFISWQKNDMKQILAYSTVSVLGLLVVLIGLGGDKALLAMGVFLCAHALSKGALFMVAGCVDHAAGTRDIRQLRGLGKMFPVLALAAMMAALSKTGFFPFLGFVGKELIYEANSQLAGLGYFLLGMIVLSNVFLFSAIFCVGLRPFWGQEVRSPHKPHQLSLSLVLGPVVLSVIGLLLGLRISVLSEFFAQATQAITAHHADVHLAIWHGLNPVFILSLVTIFLGIVWYWNHKRLKESFAPMMEVFSVYTFEKLYHWKLNQIFNLANWQTKLLQNGYLRHYMIIILTTATGLIGYQLFQTNQLSWEVDWSNIYFYEIGLCVVIALAAVSVIFVQSFLGGIIALGVVGYGIALVYILYGAPDLALTQFVIETLTVILFMSLLMKYPVLKNISNKISQVRDICLSLSVGGVVTGLLLSLNSSQVQKTVSQFFAENSYLQAHGRNVVNVIIVDFRALDTLGEITVLAVGGLGVYALLRSHRNNREKRSSS